jgi:pyruvate decarboxylase
MGRYWPHVSSPHVSTVVESSDLYLFVGPIFNDYTTTGWTALLSPSKLIDIQPNHVTVTGTRYNDVKMDELLSELADKVPTRPMSIETFKRLTDEPAETADYFAAGETAKASNTPLTNKQFKAIVQDNLTSNTDLVIETGDSWFIGQNLILPDGARYHCQMQVRLG